METKNLGQVSSFYQGASPPTNTKLLWFNTTSNSWYYYDFGLATWVPLTTGVGGLYARVDSQIKTIIKGNTTITHPSGVLVDITVFDPATKYKVDVDVKADIATQSYVKSSMLITDAIVNVIFIPV